MKAEIILRNDCRNMFNSTTNLKYILKYKSFVTVSIYDILGKEITTVVNERKPVGSYEVEFNASNLPSGVYFYRIKAGDFAETKKMFLMK